MFTNIKSQLISTCYLSKLIAENSLLKKKKLQYYTSFINLWISWSRPINL